MKGKATGDPQEKGKCEKRLGEKRKGRKVRVETKHMSPITIIRGSHCKQHGNAPGFWSRMER